MPTSSPKPTKGWVSGGDQSLAAIESLGGAAVGEEVVEALEAHIKNQTAAWTSGLMGGRGRARAHF